MANITVPIHVDLPDDWREQIVERLRNDPDAEWVEVTRCKDCKYYAIKTFKMYNNDYEKFMMCTRSGGIQHLGLNPDEFCSFAVRKKE